MNFSTRVKASALALAMVGAAALGAVALAGPASAAVGCSVTYQNLSAWLSSPTSGGFNTTLAITNLGDPITHWTLTFTMPSGQTRTGGWNATYTGTTAVTATDIGWNGAIGTGQTNTSVGLAGDWTRSTAGSAPPSPFPQPTNFALNGVACTGTTTTTTTQANPPPTVALTSPANGANFGAPATIGLAANASDTNGTVTQVQFFSGSNLLGTDTTSPYTFSWTGVPAGTYTLTARATDNGGATTTSAPVSIVVNPSGMNQIPRFSNVLPTANMTFTAPATITASATVTDPDGTVARVDFQLGSMSLSDTTAPFSVTFTNLAAGGYPYSLRATDNQGGVGVLDPVVITVTAPNTGAAPALHVSGNRILTSTGATYRLYGVNRSGGEFACIQGNGMWDGPMDQASINAMRTWKVRAVRVPLNEECWLGNGVVPAGDIPSGGTQGAAYQQAVTSYVNLLVASGITPILEMHWSVGSYTGQGAGACTQAPRNLPQNTPIAACQKPMPDAQFAPQFWTSVANTFKGNTAVILDLFNEPFPDFAANFDTTAGWNCWRNGGTCTGIPYQVAGFQSLVNTVRATGAQNIIMIGGLAFSNNIAQWLQFMPTDPTGNLVAFAHVYNFNSCSNTSCYDSQFGPVAAQVPLTISEIGENDCAHSFIDTLMTWADSHGVGYLGWTWNTWPCTSGPALITDYNGTATAFGQGLKDRLNTVSN